MKKIILSFCIILGLCACSSVPDYDTQKFFIGKGVSLSHLDYSSYQHENDGHIELQISGISNMNGTVYYKVDWYTVNNMKIKTSLSAWQPKNLTKGNEFNWSAVSPTPKAASCRISIVKNIGDGIIH